MDKQTPFKKEIQQSEGKIEWTQIQPILYKNQKKRKSSVEKQMEVSISIIQLVNGVLTPNCLNPCRLTTGIGLKFEVTERLQVSQIHRI